MVRAANAYIDRQAPWALRRTDPARMGAVLRVLADALAGGCDRLAAVHAGQHGADAGPARRAGGSAEVGRSAHPASAGTELPPPAGVFPRYVEDAAVGDLMLIDSHCHLDYFTRGRAAGCAGARRGGGRRRDGHDRHHAGASPTVVRGMADGVCRTCGARSASIRTMRPRAGARAGSDRGTNSASEGDRHRRIRSRLFLRQGPARRAAGEFPRAYPRRASGRRAARDPCARRR